MKTCIYGGQFGSEGKGSIAEAVIKKYHDPAKKLVVFGENSPNSGHTNSLGKTRNLPVSAFFADAVVMGPDSVISPACLVADLRAIYQYRVSQGEETPFQVYIHENAALCRVGHDQEEAHLVAKISSTGSGSGYSRMVKTFHRNADATVGNTDILLNEVTSAGFNCVSLVNHHQYFMLIDGMTDHDCLLECSQGSLLDINFGYFPYCTSRSTLARLAVERNGLGSIDWEYIGVYRTYPIRTGGPSGPTGGNETNFEVVGVAPEIATVTKRTRRIFEFSMDDFLDSVRLNRPDRIAFTHLDYLPISPDNINGFLGWLSIAEPFEKLARNLILSAKTWEAVFHE